MFKKLDEIVASILKAIVMGCCIGIAIILFIRVIIRFTPMNIELSWTDEVVEWMMAWMVFCAATLLFRDKAHFRVDMLPNKLEGKTAGIILDILITLCSMAFIGALFYYGIQMAMKTDQFSPMLKVPTKFPYSSIPVNGALILCYLLRDLVGDVKKFVGVH